MQSDRRLVGFHLLKSSMILPLLFRSPFDHRWYTLISFSFYNVFKPAYKKSPCLPSRRRRQSAAVDDVDDHRRWSSVRETNLEGPAAWSNRLRSINPSLFPLNILKIETHPSSEKSFSPSHFIGEINKHWLIVWKTRIWCNLEIAKIYFIMTVRRKNAG